MPTTRRTMLAGLGVLLPACAAATTSSSSPTVTPASEAAVAPNQPASLFALIERGDIASVAAVLRERPDAIDARDERDRSGLTVALLAGHPSIAALLVAHGYRPDVVESAWLGDWDRLTTLAKAEPATVDAQHALGGTSMHAGVRGGHGRELWRVYAEGASPNPERPTSIPSPLRAAFELPTLGVVEQTAGLLLGNGADPRSPEPEGSTSLHAAAARGSVLIVEMLLRKGADPNARDARGRTPAEVAAPDATIEGMLAGTIEVARDSTRWRTAFDVDDQPYRPEPIADIPGVVQRTFVGLGHGGFDQLRAQLKAQPRLLHARATTTEMVSDAAGHVGRRDILEFLLEQGAPLSMPSAVLLGDTRRVATLLDAQPERVHERGPHDFALLWYAVISGGDVEMATLLLDRGAKVEAQHFLGTTALHFAAVGGQLDLATVLLDRGADVNRRGYKFDPAGETPLAVARAHGRTKMVALLRERGGRDPS